MTAADKARQRGEIQVMMPVMSGSVHGLVRRETQPRPARWARALLASLVATSGCSIDDRTVQTSADMTANEPSPTAEPAAPGGQSAGADSSGSALDGSSDTPASSGTDPATDPGKGPPFTETSGGELPGGSGAGGSGAGAPGAAGADGSVGCAAGSRSCQEGTLYVCNESGMWASLGLTCGECVPDTSECLGSTLRVCSSAGVWIDRLQCAGSQPVCQAAAGRCVCDERSCPLGQICSSETLTCEQPVSDCPIPSPIAVTDDNDLAVTSVRFDPATGAAAARLQNIGTGIVFFDTVLCNGPDNCVPVEDQVTLQLGPRQTVDVIIPNTRIEGGELAFLDDVPERAIRALAYVAWGSGPSSNAFEQLANEFGITNWRPGQRVRIEPGDTGFVCTGNANEAAGYTSCNPAPFPP